jgi:predicted nucleic acid-binding protein
VIVVDTTVWIDFFRDADAPHVDHFHALVDSDSPIALTDVILTEVLQGVRGEREVARVERRLRAFDILRLEHLNDFTRAAALYRTARQHGITIRRTLDCLIASVCVREGASVLHNDADFDRLASCTDLVIHSPVT